MTLPGSYVYLHRQVLHRMEMAVLLAVDWVFLFREAACMLLSCTLAGYEEALPPLCCVG